MQNNSTSPLGHFVSLASIVACAVTLASCATGPIPQNAEDMRKAILGGGYGAKHDTLKVQRSYKEVAAVFKAQVKECVARPVDVQTTYKGKGGYVDRYTPTLIEGAQKMELHIQMRRVSGGGMTVLGGGEPPKDGMYVMVADVVPADGGRATQIDIYGNKVQRAFPDAVLHWVKGSNLGCPDLSKPFGQ